MKKLLIICTILLFSCSSKTTNPHIITSVFKEFPPGKIKSVKREEVMISLTYKFLKQTDGNTKHELLDCLRTDITYKSIREEKIYIEAKYYKCSIAKMVSREKFIIR
jgi:hypothetical protein